MAASGSTDPPVLHQRYHHLWQSSPCRAHWASPSPGVSPRQESRPLCTPSQQEPALALAPPLCCPVLPTIAPGEPLEECSGEWAAVAASPPEVGAPAAQGEGTAGGAVAAEAAAGPDAGTVADGEDDAADDDDSGGGGVAGGGFGGADPTTACLGEEQTPWTGV